MDFSKLSLFSAMTRRMAWLGQRQEVLAQNIANADTPGYAAQDLKEPTFRALLSGTNSRLAMAATAPGHIGGADSAKAAAEKSPDSAVMFPFTSFLSPLPKIRMLAKARGVADTESTTEPFTTPLFAP